MDQQRIYNAVVVAPQQLSAAALEQLAREFVLVQTGENFSSNDHYDDFQKKVLLAIHSGELIIVFDPDSETVSLKEKEFLQFLSQSSEELDS